MRNFGEEYAVGLTNPAEVPLGWPEPMGEEAFYGLAGKIVKTVEPSTEADPTAILVQLITAFGNVVGGQPHVRVEADRHAANLFAGLVGATAKARKGTSWGYVERLFRDMDPVWASERVQGGLSSGEGLIKAVEDGTNSEPGVADKRLFIFEPELGSTLRAMGRPTNTVSPALRQAWDSRDLRVLTRRSPLRATGAHVSIVGQTTPEDLAEHLARTEILNGFANRFLWICVRRSKLLPMGGQVPRNALQSFSRELGDSAEFARSVREVGFSQNAGKLWRREYVGLSADVPGLLGAVTSRAEAQVLRLGLIYALMNQSSEIKTYHLRAALAVWKFSFSSARFLFRSSRRIPLEYTLLDLLQRSPRGLTRTEISDKLHHHQRTEDISAALNNLKERGLAKVRTRSTAGRSAERWSGTRRGEL